MNAEERMDVIAACREVGSYRGAAEICGTTHKRVKRIVICAAAGLVGGPGSASFSASELRLCRRSGGRAGGEDAGPDLGEAVVAEGADGRLCRVGAELPATSGQAKRDWRRGHHRGRRPGCGRRVRR